MKKVGIWIVMILVFLWVINAPSKAAGLIDKVGNALNTISKSFG